MRCPICGTGNPHEARFCVSCGIPLGPQGELSPAPERTFGFAPLDLGGLLEETASVYKRNFVPFVLISLVPQLPGLVLSFALGPVLVLSPSSGPVAAETSPGLLAAVGAVFLVSLIVYPIAGGASAWAVAQQYLSGRVSIGECFRRAWYKVASLVTANLLFVLSLIGTLVLSLVLVGIPLLLYLLVVWFFFVECIIFERSGPMAALWRSREHVQGSFWRVLGIGFAYTFLFVAAVFVVPFMFRAVGDVFSDLLAVALAIVASPFIWIGRTLVYFDMRVRKEDYTMDEMAKEMGL